MKKHTHYVDELMKTHNEIEKKTDQNIDKKIEEKQKEIEKIDDKIKKEFEKAFPTPKGVKKTEKTKDFPLILITSHFISWLQVYEKHSPNLKYLGNIVPLIHLLSKINS